MVQSVSATQIATDTTFLYFERREKTRKYERAFSK